MNFSLKLDYIPTAPGVYLMKDRTGKIIYVGKAKNLKKRVSSYFHNKDLPYKIAILVAEIQHIDYIPTASERDSLILEKNLIRRLQPIYNTMWRDDKSYPYVRVTWGEDFPRIFLTRKRIKDRSKYYGPYPNVNGIKKLLKTLWMKKPFTLRPCRYDFKVEEINKGLENCNKALYKKVKSCIYLHTQECPAPCVKKITQEDYAVLVRESELFFRGEWNSILKQLELEMLEASAKMEYEAAARLRDQIRAVEHIREPVTFQEVAADSLHEETELSQGLTEIQHALGLVRPPLRIECFDNSNIQGAHPVAALVVFDRARPLKSAYRKYKIKTVVGPDDFASMREIVLRRYKRLAEEEKRFPDLVLIDGGKGQLGSAQKAMVDLKKMGYKIPPLALASLAKREEEIFLPDREESIRLPMDSKGLLILRHIRDEAHRFAITFHRQKRKDAFFKGGKK